jgi:hypothetical protein
LTIEKRREDAAIAAVHSESIEAHPSARTDLLFYGPIFCCGCSGREILAE